MRLLSIGDVRNSDRVASLDETELIKSPVIETYGCPIYVSEAELAGYTGYDLTEPGWHLFVRVAAKDGVVVGPGAMVIGAAGYIAETGEDHIDIAVCFGTSAETQKVVINWGGSTETFMFRATDLAIRNLDYRVTFYQYDISPYATWTWAAATGTFTAGAHYFTRTGTGTTDDPYVYTEAEFTAGQSIPANTYYKHTAVRFTGFVKNLSYSIPYIDCPITIDLPDVDTDDQYGAWFELQLNLDTARSIALVAPAGTTVSGNGVASPKAGVGIINMMFHKPTKKWLTTVTNWT